MVNDGRIPAYRLGTSIVRFRIEDIDAAFEAQC
jgi:excisionase family DNA binding protein